MKVVAIVQARIGSTRLPGKVMKKIVGKPMIEILLSRLSKSKELDEIVVTTSKSSENDKLQLNIESLGYRCTRGSEKNVLSRYKDTAKSVGADIIVRITGDCPLVDPAIVDKCVRNFKKSDVDYFSNTYPRTYPDGLDVAVISYSALERADAEAKSDFDREHVTSYIINSNNFTKLSFKHSKDLSDLRWTVDNHQDLTVVKNIFNYFSPNLNFSWKEVLKLQNFKPELFLENQKIKNNESKNLGTGQKLYKRAKKIIPGGNMLLSKSMGDTSEQNEIL